VTIKVTFGTDLPDTASVFLAGFEIIAVYWLDFYFSDGCHGSNSHADASKNPSPNQRRHDSLALTAIAEVDDAGTGWVLGH